ncbi:hypothetical protein SteCoe_10707 [Stentor coeruleus]|uniref:Peptidase A1 domain-containing protein n=1 Tax=Stentor coeruleus TaxID=5963 RepID=A0A1R2CEU5_9CILI|nr:hypothetical protein SteCoe_10707 [Stentor coeruleus]
MIILFVFKIALAYKSSEIKDSLILPVIDSLFGKYATLKLGGNYKNNQAMYSVSVFLGNPAKEFNLLLDINSYHTWVEEKQCKVCNGFQNQYSPEDSLTFLNLSVKAFGESPYYCSFSGYSVSDFLSLYSDISVISTRIPFAMANYDNQCTKTNFDGSLGLAPLAIFTPTPIINYFNTSNEISESVFAIYLNNFTSKSGYFTPSSSLMIGNFNLSDYSSNPESVFYISTVENSSKWKVVFDELIVGKWSSPLNVNVIISSTSTKIQGDINDLISFAPDFKLLGLECYIVPNIFVFYCLTDDPNILPDLVFKYKNSTIVFPSSNIWECKKKNCTMDVIFDDGGFWVFGQSVLQSYFTIFNYDNQSIGFAPAISAEFHEKQNSMSVWIAISFLVSIII